MSCERSQTSSELNEVGNQKTEKLPLQASKVVLHTERIMLLSNYFLSTKESKILKHVKFISCITDKNFQKQQLMGFS